MSNYGKNHKCNQDDAGLSIAEDVERGRGEQMRLIEENLRAVGKREGYAPDIVDFAIECRKAEYRQELR